jgi:hypothetical protein
MQFFLVIKNDIYLFIPKKANGITLLFVKEDQVRKNNFSFKVEIG